MNKIKIKNIIKINRKKRSMSTRLSVAYAVLAIMVIAFAAVFFYQFYQYNIFTDGKKNVRQQSLTSIAQIDNCLTAMEQATVDVLSDNRFMETWMKARESKKEEDALAVRRILTQAYSNKSNIRRISVYSEDGMWFCTGNVSVGQEAVQERIQMIKDSYNMRYFNSRAYLPPHRDFWNPENSATVISEIKPIKDKNTQIVGYIEVQQNTMYLERICELTWNGEPIDVLIFKTDTDELFYMNLPYNTETMEYADKVRELTRNSMYYEESKKSIYYCAYSNVSASKMVLAMDKASFTKSGFRIIYGLLAVVILLIIVTILYSVWATRTIMKPINLLVKRMEKTDLNNFSEKFEIRSPDRDTEILVNSFEQMAKRLQESMKRQKQLEYVQTKTIFRALQSTMGPHFLYNSLGGIANLCEREENEAAADACYSLTEILRYASDYENAEVTIRDEISNVHDYMAIMKSRYRQRIEFKLYVDKEAEEIMIPKLTLQPLLENAIRYSLMERETVLVKIFVIIFENKLMIEVKDNGCGITQEKAVEIREKVKESHDTEKIEPYQVKFGGIGLVGTLIRLTIYYGDSFQYEIQSDNDEGGTSIQFCIDFVRYR